MRRAFVLVLALFTIVALAISVYGALRVLPVEQNSLRRQLLTTQAALAADAGVQAAMERIEFNLAHGIAQPAQETLAPLRADLLGPFTYSVTIAPDALTLAGNPYRVYRVNSQAWFRPEWGPARPLRRVEAVLTTQSFAKWVWFHDTRPEDLYLPLSSWTFDGPIHFNSPIRVQDVGPSFYSGNHTPFLANVTSATRIENVAGESGVPAWASRGDGVKYTESASGMTAASVPYSTGTGEPNAARYSRLYAGGRDALRTGIAPVDMPLNFDDIRKAAWGSTDPLPGQTGVYVSAAGTRPTGGVLIVGDPAEVEMHVANSNSGLRIRLGSYDYQWVEVTDNTETVSATNSSGQAIANYTVSPGQAYLQRKRVGSNANITVTTFSEGSNGAVFCTGNIASLWGTNKLRRTIAVDLVNRRELTVTDDVLRADVAVSPDALPGNISAIRPQGVSDRLGLVGWKVNVSQSHEPGGRRDTNPLFIYASVYAGHQKIPSDPSWNENDELGGFYDTYTSGPAGVLHLFGGFQMAWKNSTTYSLQLHFDQLLAATPPPFFPSFNRCRILSWREYPVGQ